MCCNVYPGSTYYQKRGYPRGPKYTVRESLKIVSDGFLGVMTIVIILLGVCTGLFTTTESAAIACVYALFVTLFIYKSIKVKISGELQRNPWEPWL